MMSKTAQMLAVAFICTLIAPAIALARVVIATAADGYQVVFALAEIDAARTSGDVETRQASASAHPATKRENQERFTKRLPMPFALAYLGSQVRGGESSAGRT